MKVHILLDASGSMETSWNEMLSAINSYVDKLEGNVLVSLSTFDSGAYLNYRNIRNVAARDWKNVTRDDVRPGGGTPLLDAMGFAMWSILEDKQDRAIFVVVTDGEENASRKFQKYEVDNLLTAVKARDYPVLYLGANFDKVESQASLYGVARSFTTSIKPSMYTDTFVNLAASSMNYMATGEVKTMAMSEDFKKKASS